MLKILEERYIDMGKRRIPAPLLGGKADRMEW